jgi:uncharacterized protein (DUF433 family)
MNEELLTFIDGRITIDPAICNVRPTIRGKRIMVQTILEYLAAGDSEADILEQYPGLEPADIRACLQWALTQDASSPLYRALDTIGFIGCIDADEELSTTYKQKLDFSDKRGGAR